MFDSPETRTSGNLGLGWQGIATVYLDRLMTQGWGETGRGFGGGGGGQLK